MLTAVEVVVQSELEHCASMCELQTKLYNTQDAGEPGIPGVTVEITDSLGNT